MQQIVTNSEITAQQTALITELLTGANVTKAAATIGINRVTAWRWQQDPAFAAALAEAQANAVGAATSRLLGLVESSIDVLVTLRDTGTNGDSVRLKSATTILEFATRLHSDLVVAQRLAALEQLIDSQDN